MTDNGSGICYYYVMDVSRFNHEDTFSRYYHMMPEYRREKIDALIPRASKNLSLGVGVLLENAKNRLGLRDCDIISVEEIEKEATFYYNLSHSGSRAVCAVSDVRVGCDVEKIQTDEKHIESTMKIVGRFFTESEAAYINERFDIEEGLSELDRQARVEVAAGDFYRYWVLKESVIKVMGQGLAMPLDSFGIDITGETPLLSPVGDWTVQRGMELDRYRLYEPEVDNEYAYGLCIASPDEYDVELEIVN